MEATFLNKLMFHYQSKITGRAAYDLKQEGEIGNYQGNETVFRSLLCSRNLNSLSMKDLVHSTFQQTVA